MTDVNLRSVLGDRDHSESAARLATNCSSISLCLCTSEVAHLWFDWRAYTSTRFLSSSWWVIITYVHEVESHTVVVSFLYGLLLKCSVCCYHITLGSYKSKTINLSRVRRCFCQAWTAVIRTQKSLKQSLIRRKGLKSVWRNVFLLRVCARCYVFYCLCVENPDWSDLSGNRRIDQLTLHMKWSHLNWVKSRHKAEKWLRLQVQSDVFIFWCYIWYILYLQEKKKKSLPWNQMSYLFYCCFLG